MRKYYQLLLLIVSILSITLFLVYKHEYNRLHYVLEVFNFFGQPCNISDLRTSENTIVQHDWGPIPIWYENDGLYTYSGFWTEKSEAKVIAFHNGTKRIPRNCYLWFEDKSKPIIGKFRYSNIEGQKQDTFSAHYYYCNMNEYPHIPYAVSFGKAKKEDKLDKILLKSTGHKIVFNITMCVVPSQVFNKNEFIEFLSFHSLIGIDSYIFYSNNIPYRLQKIITNLSTRLGITIVFLPWNSVNIKTNITHQIVESDCTLRALSNSHNIVTLFMNEYIVPSKYFALKDVINYFNNQTGRIALPVQAFCIQNTNHRKPIALQNVDVAYYNDNIVRQIIRNVEQNNVIKIGSANYQVASVHKYIYCTEKSERNYPDKSIMKYSTDFVRSTLVQLYLHDQI